MSNAISLVACCLKEVGLDVVFTEAFRKISCGWTAIVAYLRLEVKKGLSADCRTFANGVSGRRSGQDEYTPRRTEGNAAEPKTIH